MPTSDIVFAIIGLLDFASIFAVILWTGLVTRKDAASAEKPNGGEVRG